MLEILNHYCTRQRQTDVIQKFGASWYQTSRVSCLKYSNACPMYDRFCCLRANIGMSRSCMDRYVRLILIESVTVLRLRQGNLRQFSDYLVSWEAVPSMR